MYLTDFLSILMFCFSARGASLADFIQPSLGPLQPNLDDFMDTLEPLQGKNFSRDVTIYLPIQRFFQKNIV